MYSIPVFSYPAGTRLGVELLDHNGNSVFNFLRKHQIVFFSGCTILHCHQHLFFFFSFLKNIISILVDVERYLAYLCICFLS